MGQHATDTSCYRIRKKEVLENSNLARNNILSSEFQENFQGGYTAEYYNAALFNLIRRLLHFLHFVAVVVVVSNEYTCSLETKSRHKQWRVQFSAMWLPFQRQSLIAGV